MPGIELVSCHDVSLQVRKTPLDKVEVVGGVAAGIHKEGGTRMRAILISYEIRQAISNMTKRRVKRRWSSTSETRGPMTSRTSQRRSSVRSSVVQFVFEVIESKKHEVSWICRGHLGYKDAMNICVTCIAGVEGYGWCFSGVLGIL